MRRHLLTALILSLFSYSAASDSTFPGVSKLMSAEQFKAAGLDKLSEEERRALNDWLIEYTAFEAPQMRQDNDEVKEAEKAFKVQSNVVPAFTGWEGKTVFTLENGQVWRQRLSGRFSYNGDDTEVVIQKNFMGYYKMTHTASGRSVGVTRLK